MAMRAVVLWMLLILGAVFAASSCGGDGTDSTGEPSGQPPVVIATTSIWSDIVSNVACDDVAAISTLIPTGGDPHGFEPSLADRGDLDDAALVVANGLGLEELLDDTLTAVEESGTPVFRVGGEMVELGLVDGDDPHVWFDPVNVSSSLPGLARALIAEAGLDADRVNACTDAYRSELEQLDADLADSLAPIPGRDRLLVTNHDSLGQFADRYGFEVVGAVTSTSSGLAETNPAELEELATLVEEAGVPAIFAESQHSADDAEALADRVGDIEVVELLTGTLGAPGSGADTYVGFMRTNIDLIAEALS